MDLLIVVFCELKTPKRPDDTSLYKSERRQDASAFLGHVSFERFELVHGGSA